METSHEVVEAVVLGRRTPISWNGTSRRFPFGVPGPKAASSRPHFMPGKEAAHGDLQRGTEADEVKATSVGNSATGRRAVNTLFLRHAGASPPSIFSQSTPPCFFPMPWFDQAFSVSLNCATDAGGSGAQFARQ